MLFSHCCHSHPNLFPLISLLNGIFRYNSAITLILYTVQSTILLLFLVILDQILFRCVYSIVISLSVGTAPGRDRGSRRSTRQYMPLFVHYSSQQSWQFHTIVDFYITISLSGRGGGLASPHDDSFIVSILFF